MLPPINFLDDVTSQFMEISHHLTGYLYCLHGPSGFIPIGDSMEQTETGHWSKPILHVSCFLHDSISFETLLKPLHCIRGPVKSGKLMGGRMK